MTERCHAAVLIGSALLILLASQIVGAVGQRVARQRFRTTVPEPADARQARLLVLSGSYGRHGIDIETLDRTLGLPCARWVCDGTSPLTWRLALSDPRVLSASTETVVLQLAPSLVRADRVFQDSALRHTGLEAVMPLLRRRQLDRVSTLLAYTVLPLLRYREGLRRRALVPAARVFPAPLGSLIQLRGIPWTDWSADPSELWALADMARTLRARGVRLVVAEWPLSMSLRPLQGAIAARFRPTLAALAATEGFTFLALPVDHGYQFGDGIHPTRADGRRWSAWLAERLRTR